MKPKQSLRRSSRFRRAFIESFVALTAISWGDIADGTDQRTNRDHNKAVFRQEYTRARARVGRGQLLDLAMQGRKKGFV
jgi:hypothetical protein